MEDDGSNHCVLEVTWAQQDHGPVFNSHPTLPKKGYFCWLQAAGPGERMQQLTLRDQELRAESTPGASAG